MFIKPQLATLYDGFPPGKWIYEVKFDGYRMQANRPGGKSRLFTRYGLNWLSRFSFINAGLDKLPAGIIVDDGKEHAVGRAQAAGESRLSRCH